jgi:hypothetical protein
VLKKEASSASICNKFLPNLPSPGDRRGGRNTCKIENIFAICKSLP